MGVSQVEGQMRPDSDAVANDVSYPAVTGTLLIWMRT
jgi:hypothetical protein